MNFRQTDYVSLVERMERCHLAGLRRIGTYSLLYIPMTYYFDSL